MNVCPAVIMLADDQSARSVQPSEVGADALGSRLALQAYSPISTLIRRVQSMQMPMTLVAPSPLVASLAHLLSQDQMLPVDAPGVIMQHSDWLVRGMAAGIMSCSHASGWIVLPVDMPMVKVSTMLALADELRHTPVVYPCHGHKRGHPIAFSAELFSELVQLSTEQDLRRLVARYPAAEVDVDDPGIHMAVGAHSGLDQWRAQLGAHVNPHSLAFSSFIGSA
jgi:molybdenum cofactor cytidylyltransferase